MLAILTLGAFIYGHTAHGLVPFSETLGIEGLTRAELIELVDEELIPANWDELTVGERTEETLAVSDAPGSGEESGSGNPIIDEAERIPRTLAFTVLALGQIFHVMAISGGEQRSFFQRGFGANRFMLIAVILTFALQLGVIYLPFMQTIFETFPLRLSELGVGLAIASVILFAVEIEKAFTRRAAAA